MTAARSGPILLLALTIGGWTAARTTYVAWQDVSAQPADGSGYGPPPPPMLLPLTPEPWAMGDGNPAGPARAQEAAMVAMGPERSARSAIAAAALQEPPGPGGGAADAISHAEFVAAQLLLLRQMMRPGRVERWNVTQNAMLGRFADAEVAPPAAAGRDSGLLPILPTSPRGMVQAEPGRWAAAAWALYRDSTNPASPVSRGQLGGSQAGVRLSYRLDARGTLHAFARATATPGSTRSAEGALGVELRPVANVPAALVVERRQRVAGPDGRSAFAAYAIAGADDVPLPAGFALHAYGAAGVVGARRRDLFAEGAARSVRPVTRIGPVRISAGGGAWAAAQPQVSRLDIGPTVETRWDTGSGPSPRLSVDYRYRVAGTARPDSGIAVTLAADF